MRHLLKKIHLWLSIPAGLIICIICITGAILSFDIQILEAYYPERYFVEEVKKEVIPLDKLIPIVNSQLKDNTVSSIKITSDPSRTYTATLSEGFRISAFVDPYTGSIKGIYEFKESFFFKIMSIHRWLMDGTRTWGKYTVGIATLLFVFILISGIFWWVPSQKKKLKNRLTIKTNKGLKRFINDAHLVLGIYASIFLLICALTGLMWSFDWYRNGVSKLFGVETSNNSGGHKGRDEKKKIELNTDCWEQAFTNISQKVDFESITLSDGSAAVLSKSAPHLRATDKYMFDNKSGTIGEISYFADLNNSSKMMSWAYALHVGAYGGILTKILTCLACIIGATLPLSGYYVFYQKRIKRKKHKS